MSAVATDVFFSSSSILSSTSDPHRRSKSRQFSTSTKRPERQSVPRNQVFGGSLVDSFLVSSSSTIPQSSISISRQDIPKIVSPPTKRYVSSFKTLVNSTNGKHTQRLSYVNDSVIILKLSKENATENNDGGSHLSSKYSTVSMATSTTIVSPFLKQQPSPSSSLSPLLKVEGQKRRTVYHDSPLIAPTTDASVVSSSTNNMATSTTTQPSPNPSLFVYRSTVTGGNTVRQRAIPETTTNSLLFSTDRFKTNISSSMRPARQPLTTTTTTTMSSAYISSQQPQRNVNQNAKTRLQQDKLANSRDIYDYSDPFTNCPQDVLSKLAHLTKLQLETVEWEKKRRFTKKKPTTNSTIQGKDSP